MKYFLILIRAFLGALFLSLMGLPYNTNGQTNWKSLITVIVLASLFSVTDIIARLKE